MRQLRLRIRQLWSDNDGSVFVEYLLLLTIVGIGVIAGLATVRASLLNELIELANAIAAITPLKVSAGKDLSSSGCPKRQHEWLSSQRDAVELTNPRQDACGRSDPKPQQQEEAVATTTSDLPLPPWLWAR